MQAHEVTIEYEFRGSFRERIPRSRRKGTPRSRGRGLGIPLETRALRLSCRMEGSATPEAMQRRRDPAKGKRPPAKAALGFEPSEVLPCPVRRRNPQVRCNPRGSPRSQSPFPGGGDSCEISKLSASLPPGLDLKKGPRPSIAGGIVPGAAGTSLCKDKGARWANGAFSSKPASTGCGFAAGGGGYRAHTRRLCGCRLHGRIQTQWASGESQDLRFGI